MREEDSEDPDSDEQEEEDYVPIFDDERGRASYITGFSKPNFLILTD